MNNRFRMTKGFIMGALAMLILSGTALMASPQMRELVFGVGVSFNGEAVQFDANSQPFIIDGRTFLPVRAIADIAGLDVDFDSATNTVLLTSGAGGAAAQPGNRFADTFFSGTSGSNFARVDESVSILGATHQNVVQYNSFATNALYSQHNLGGNFTRLTGVFGRIDGVGVPTDVDVTITGDGAILTEFSLGEHDIPRNIDLDVTGIQLIRVDINPHGAGGPAGTRGAWALSADLQ